MSNSRWLRLNIDWDDSPWVFTLSPECQLAWIKLLCHVKRDGVGGKVKALAALVAARKWSVGEESVVKLLQAAQNDGALTHEDGYWVLTNWAVYQAVDKTNYERQKRHRKKKKDDNGDNAVTPVADRSPCHATLTETETETYNPPLSPQGGKKKKPFAGADIPEEYLEAAEAWANYRKSARLKPWTKQTWEMRVNQLSPERFALGVQYSISQGYQGFYLPKETDSVQSLLERARGAS